MTAPAGRPEDGLDALVDPAAATAAELDRLRTRLAEVEQEADRTLFRVTRLAQVISVLGQPDQDGGSRTVSAIAELFSCDVGLLLLGDDDRLSVAERWGVTGDVLPDRPLAAPPAATALTEQRTVLAGRAGDAPVPPGLGQLDLVEVAWIRLIVHGDRLGYLFLGRRSALPFSGADAHELRAVGQRVALSLDNLRLLEHSRDQVRQLQRMLAVGTWLAGCVRVVDAARVIVDALQEAAPGVVVGVYRSDDDGWRLVAEGGPDRLPADELPVADDRVEIVPLRDGRREVGCIVARDLPRTPELHQVLDHLTDVAGLALSKILLHERTAHQARHDALTGLCNRLLLRERIDQALAKERGAVALVFCDLDRFKQINDTLGHDAGDRLLVEIGQRLVGAVRPGDTVARLGGDEFVILCSGIRDTDEAAAIARRIATAVEPPVDVGGREVVITTSQGIVLGTPGATADDLLRDADLAMYHAKSRGRARYELFDQQVRVQLDHRAATEATLRQALRDDRLRTVYQPLVDLDSGRVLAVEALVRYLDADGRLVPAGEFIAVAEESDLIVQLGTWVLEEAARQVAAWRAGHGADGPSRVLVNVAARQLSQGLDALVADVLVRNSLPPEAIALELTETSLLDASAEVQRCLAGLRRLGVDVGVDDFGTGYSSLTYLKRFPLDFVKIDREFVQGMVEGPEDAGIVDAILKLTEALGLQTVAEGVETTSQRSALQQLGCELAQGFLFSRPLTAEQLEEHLRSGTLRTQDDPSLTVAAPPTP